MVDRTEYSQKTLDVVALGSKKDGRIQDHLDGGKGSVFLMKRSKDDHFPF